MEDSRRRFLAMATTSLATFVLAAHRSPALGDAIPEGSRMPGKGTDPRILRLRLSTAAPLGVMREFYGKALGLPVTGEGPNEITVRGGSTSITFVTASPTPKAPFYHFAFNIPENQIRLARRWQLERTELLPVFPDLRDPDYPDDVVHFRHWNAHSVFFLDPAGNVVEYIARHDLRNADERPFDADSMLYASEIGFTVDDVPAAATGLQQACALGPYGQGSHDFCALGDERGLLLVFRRGRNLSLGAAEPRSADVFPVEAGIRTGAAMHYAMPDYPYRISTE